MRVWTKVISRWDDQRQRYVTVEAESAWHEYDGAVACCDRSQSAAAFNQATDQSNQDQSNAQSALTGTNTALANYNNNLNNYVNWGNSTYGANGEFAQDQNTLGTTTAAAGGNAIGGKLAMNALKTGENTASYAPTLATSQREAEGQLTNQLASADATRLQNLGQVNQNAVTMSGLPAQIQSQIYGTSTGGANAAEGNATNTAKTPGFLDSIAGNLISGAASVGAAFCPCEGSMIRMADMSLKRVEDLRKGDLLHPLGGFTPPNPVLEDPEVKEVPCWEIETATGRKHAGSETHTLALSTGGYGYMPELLDKTLIAEYEADVVTAARSIGVKRVYPLKVGGSHCYVADGLMVLA